MKLITVSSRGRFFHSFSPMSPGRTQEILEPRVGVEPTTCRLRIGCSTTELPRPFIIKDLFRCLAPCVQLAFHFRRPLWVSARRDLTS